MPTVSTFSDYTSKPAGSPGASGGETDEKVDYWSLDRCKRAYTDYLTSKRDEILEQQDARRYRHAVQWTAAQIEVLNKRKQPVVTYNRVGRKIDGIVGLVEKLRQDPKAYPRTPKHEQGAELATAALRYALESQDWKAKSPISAEDGAVDGLGGLELELTEGDQTGQEQGRDKEISFDVVEPDSFFYDPRSFRLDFTDARYMGIGKWVDAETAKEMFPDKADEIDSSIEAGSELTTNSDRDQRWFMSDNRSTKRIRLCDIWYRHKGGWCWCLFTGSLKLMEGKSYFFDEKGKPISKFIMFSASVDQDGDRYGFVRNLKSAQDEINQRRSKGLHELNTRRIIAEEGAFPDVEIARREAARPDGIVIRNPGMEAEFDDSHKQQALQGQLEFLADAKAEIENFGPNPALIGQGIENKSGRAIQLLQQAGIAELGPFILSYRGWKLRVYRAIWGAIQRYWSGERWVRVTDDDGIAQFIKLNGVGIDPQTGMPAMVNAIGSLDVDIILDEGPDQITVMADVYDALSQMLPSIAPMLQPAEAKAAVQLLVSTSPLPASAKKQFKDASQQQPDPAAQQAQQQAQQLQMAGAQAEVQKTQSEAALNMAKAQQAGMPEPGAPPQQPQPPEVPIEVQTALEAAKVADTHAAADLKRTQAAKLHTETVLMPAKMAHEAQNTAADRQFQQQNADADREARAKEAQQRFKQRPQAPRS